MECGFIHELQVFLQENLIIKFVLKPNQVDVYKVVKL